MRAWTGDAGFFLSGNNRKDGGEENDYYATEPRATHMLLARETFCPRIWEPACGEGHISKVLEAHGYEVFNTDLIDRGFGLGGVDFLAAHQPPVQPFDIITNPPYRFAQEFCERALAVVPEGHKVAMFLKLTFLEGKRRQRLYAQHPPQTVYVFSSRVCCGRNGQFDPARNAVAYAWFVWQKGFQGVPRIQWINEVPAK